MSRPPTAPRLSPSRITDVHIHVQPWRELKPNVLEIMWRGEQADRDLLIQVMDDPRALLEVMDRSGVWRAGLVNYPSPDVMGFTDASNAFAAKYAQADPARLLPYGGVHPRFTKDPAGDVDRLADLGTRLVKIHPPHQGMPANAYTNGLDALGKIYRRCEERGLPVMIHTGTSIFPGARSKYGNPMDLDDVAIDFPDLKINLSHTGWPWTGEFISMLWRHPNVYGDISAYYPKSLDPELVRAMDRQLRHKIMLGSNGFDLQRCCDELDQLPLKEQTKERILRENALEFLGLD